MMRTAIGCLLLMLGVTVESTAAAPSLPWTHTRPLTPSAAQLIADASARSSIVTAMLDSLEQTDVVVYVVDSMLEADQARAYLRFVSYAAGTRYLMVHLDRWRVMPRDCTAWLAHELQHALEIAASPDVRDAAGLTRLYRSIGWEAGKGRFETDLARAAGKRVWNEMAGLDPRR